MNALRDTLATAALPDQSAPASSGSLAEALGGWLRQARTLAERAGASSLITELNSLGEQRRRAGFRVAVVGEFNRGKSTLINRLVGLDLLPTGPVPTTRGFVVVAAGEQVNLTVRWPDGQVEHRTGGPQLWAGLATDPLDSAGSTDGAEAPRLRLDVPCAWLADSDTELIDTPGTNESVEDRLLDVRRAVTRSDGVLMVVSAGSPLSRTERQLLEQEVLRRAVPFVTVVVTFLDQLLAAERATALEAVRARVHQLAPNTPVLPGPRSAEDTGNLDDIRGQLGMFAARNSNRAWRSRKLATDVADLCTAVADVATVATEAAALADDQQRTELARERAALDRDSGEWETLRVELDARRRVLAGRVRNVLDAGTDTVVETLRHDLLRSPDPKEYWERDMPYRLRRELVALTRHCEAVVLAGMSADIDWLEQTLAGWLGAGAGMPRPRPGLAVPAVTEPAPVVDDLGRRKLLTRVGATGGSILGYVLGGAVGLAVPPMAIAMVGGLVAGVVAERSLRGMIKQQRDTVDSQLRHLVDQVIDVFAEQVSDRVRHIYAELVDNLAARGAAWRAARLDALTATTADTRTEELAELVASATALADAIRQAVAADLTPVTDLPDHTAPAAEESS